MAPQYPPPPSWDPNNPPPNAALGHAPSWPTAGGQPNGGIPRGSDHLQLRNPGDSWLSGGSQSVGFSPGWVGGRSPGLTKWRYQQMLYRDMYAAQDLRAYYQNPRVMGMFWFMLSVGIVMMFAFIGLLLVVSAWSTAGVFAALVFTGVYLVGLVVGFGFLVLVWFRAYIRGVMIHALRRGEDLYASWRPREIQLAGGIDKLTFEAFMDPVQREEYIEWQKRFM